MPGIENSSLYDRAFFQGRRPNSISSASVVVSLILDKLAITSVADIGCADGAWLSVFLQKGVDRILGVDGPWVDTDQLLIPKQSFRSHDLSIDDPAVEERFDLAISVEVAEHLPPERARSFVAFLTSLSTTVLFSAAVRDQGGTGHVNEQPQSYWAGLFLEAGYACFDAVRPAIWDRPDVNIVHAQNLLLYSKDSRVMERLSVATVAPQHYAALSVIHPSLYSRRLEQERRKRLSYRVHRKARRLFRGD